MTTKAPPPIDSNFQIETGIGPTIDKMLNCLIDRITADNFKDKVTDKFMDPLTKTINEKIQPYVYTSIGLYSIVIILLLIIIYLIIIKK